MLFKLVLNNIRKSYKDYLIYFLTISITIAMYYMFNSLESQRAMIAFKDSDYEVIQVLIATLGYVSTFLTFVMGFLMVYANQFLIKRRKKELGLYMTLGMPRLKIVTILFLETLLTGVFSLIVGIFIGFIGSHFLSIITAKMFLFELREFRFIFSVEGMIKSILVFGFVYLLMMIFNSFSMMRVKLIDLLYPKKNESQKIKKPWMNIAIFILSIASLGYAYFCISINGMLNINSVFAQAILFGIIGSFLFFMSLAGIMYEIIKKVKPIYYHRLNIFSMRQIFSKVNTTYRVMAIISVMLLIAIGTFATGNGTAMAINDNVEKSTPFDFTYALYQPVDELVKDLPGDHYLLSLYSSNILYSEIIEHVEDNTSPYTRFVNELTIPFIKLSEYNVNREARGLEPIALAKNEFLISYKDKFNAYMRDDAGEMTIHHLDETFVAKDFIIESLFTGESSVGLGYVIINDEFVVEDTWNSTVINTLIDDPNVYREFYNRELGYIDNMATYFDVSDGISYTFVDKEDYISASIGYSVVITYVAIYVGIVFIIASVVILALQQLTEASDNIHRYQLLMKLGVEEKQIKQSILIQISTYFLLPMVLGIVHSCVGVSVASDVVKIFGYLDAWKNAFFTACFVLAIYGSYFIVTYITIKSMVLNKRMLRQN